ncbi:MAG: hypothetical protein QGI78_00610 [Phycisphaerales bacterium]|jgi:hypothetical protein|nr:hypothetical protein [Phycisphaerales bacterium]
MKYLVFLLVSIFLACCSPVATYPPIEVGSAVRFSNSSYEPVPTILVTTLEYSKEHFGGLETTVFNLPKGMSHDTYAIVSSRVLDSTPMMEAEQQAYHITELRVRGLRAEADVVFPSAGGTLETATLYLSKSLAHPWRVNRERIWLIPVATAPSPNYEPQDQSVAIETE